MPAVQSQFGSGLCKTRGGEIVKQKNSPTELMQREQIDRQFAAIADDKVYQKAQLALAESFANSDWEALILGEVWHMN